MKPCRGDSPVQEKLVNSVSEKNEVIQCFSSVMKTTAVGETREKETTAPIPVATDIIISTSKSNNNKFNYPLTDTTAKCDHGRSNDALVVCPNDIYAVNLCFM